MDIITLVSLAALAVKIVSVLKALGKDNNLVVTQLLTWAVGIAVLSLAATADLTSGLVLFDGASPLGELDLASVVLAGLQLSSLGSFGYDVKKAFDNTDSAQEPKLLSR